MLVIIYVKFEVKSVVVDILDLDLPHPMHKRYHAQ